MKPQLKSYYLIQSAYWIQQLLVLVLKLEKPRKDYAELVAHHIVTLWLVGYVFLAASGFVHHQTCLFMIAGVI
jgi:very-long-chain ceramide synthase